MLFPYKLKQFSPEPKLSQMTPILTYKKHLQELQIASVIEASTPINLQGTCLHPICGDGGSSHI